MSPVCHSHSQGHDRYDGDADENIEEGSATKAIGKMSRGCRLVDELLQRCFILFALFCAIIIVVCGIGYCVVLLSVRYSERLDLSIYLFFTIQL